MSDFRNLGPLFQKAMGLERRPVAVAFRDVPPAGVAKFSGAEPSGCSYWRLAAEGRVFYTVPSDHFNCPIGSYTHNIGLPRDRAQELDQTLSLMVQIGYLKMEEVPSIPRLPQTPAVVVYAPLGESPVEPDLAIFSGPPGRISLLIESAQRAGVCAGIPILGRPTCMAIPAALAGGIAVSAACIGNRVYTGIGENDLYAAVSAKDLRKIASEMETIVSANATLAQYHRGRRAQLATE